MRKVILLFIAYFFFIVTILQADEIGSPELRKAETGLDLGIRYWRSTGDASFQISGTDPDVGRWNSVLEYPMDGNFLILRAQYRFITLLSKLSIDLNYGFSNDIDGTTKDTDHLLSITTSPYIYSETETDADSSFFNSDIYYQIFQMGKEHISTFDIFIGYQHQKNSFTSTNIHTTIYEYEIVDDIIPGKGAEYDMEFNALRIGIRSNIPVARKLTINGFVALMPYVDFDGDGNWILREKTFTQSADGSGIDIELSLGYEATKNLLILFGVKYLNFDIDNGRDKQYRRGEYLGSFHIDYAEADQFGFTLGLSYKF